jgi:tRNA-dihydrouridine synthase
VFGSGDCLEAGQVIDRLRSGVDGVFVGRGVLRNPWILAQAADVAAGRQPREVTLADRGRFLLEYIELLTRERVHDHPGLRSDAARRELRQTDEPAGFRHRAPGTLNAERGTSNVEGMRTSNVAQRTSNGSARGHDRWVINKVRALGSWYTKGLDNGSHLRTAVNAAESLDQLREVVSTFFLSSAAPVLVE